MATPQIAPSIKKDQGKNRLDLIPPEALEGLGAIYSMGANKYSPRGWEKGDMTFGSIYAALLRHANAFWKGEWLDEESGLPHLYHCAWNAICLAVYTQRGIGKDDRKDV